MKWAFDNSTKLIGVMSFALIAISTVHDWAYFLVVGPKFRSIQTTYDYISNAIEWFPAVLFFASGFLLSPILDWLFKTEPQEERGFETHRKQRRKAYARKVGIAGFVLTAIMVATLPFRDLPDLLYMLPFVGSMLCFSFYQLLNHRMTAAARGAFFNFVICSFVLALAFGAGIGDGFVASRGLPTNVHQVDLRGGDSRWVSVLRSFEKGLLIRDPVRQKIEFIRWENIEGLSRMTTTEVEEAYGCRWLTLFCKREHYYP